MSAGERGGGGFAIREGWACAVVLSPGGLSLLALTSDAAVHVVHQQMQHPWLVLRDSHRLEDILDRHEVLRLVCNRDRERGGRVSRALPSTPRLPGIAQQYFVASSVILRHNMIVLTTQRDEYRENPIERGKK